VVILVLKAVVMYQSCYLMKKREGTLFQARIHAGGASRGARHPYLKKKFEIDREIFKIGKNL
jgi:hypothetical protein